ncbi:hypothetical protein OAF66_00240 [bacterium]|nr:hypothetical protein [bacterium]
MRRLPTVVLVLGSITGVIHAETHAVLPGGSVQEKIDVAVDGDIVAIFGGTYNEDLTVTKRIRLVEVNGQEVTLAGNITFSGIENCPPFEGFTVGSNANTNITITDTTGLVISEIDHTAGNSIEINGESTVEITDCSLVNLDPDAGVTSVKTSSLTGRVEQNGGAFNISDTTIAGNFETGNDAAKTVAFRVTVTGDCNWRSNRSWFGYGKARSFNFNGSDAKVIFVGGEIDRLGLESDGMLLQGNNNTITITNSKITGTISDWTRNDTNIEITGSGHSIKVLNNYLKKEYRSNDGGGYHHFNIVSSVSTLTVANNIVSNTVDGMVYAPFGAKIFNNHSANSRNYGVEGGTSVVSNTTEGDPLFVDGSVYELGEGSPCIDAGTEDARYNDRDGTRNNIGPSGGSWYDPEGWTTEKPVVISFDLTPDQVLEGVNTEVTIDDVRAVSGQ